MRSICLRVVLAAAVLVLTPGAAQAQSLAFPSPFLGGARTDVNELGQAVIAWAGRHGVRAVIGDRAGGLGPASVLSTTGDTVAAPLVAISDAGDAVVIWETTRTLPGSGCSTCGSRTVSTGVWASLRPAGAPFGTAIALAGPRADSGADYQVATPAVAMSASGHAVIAWSDPGGGAASLRAPGGPFAPTQRIGAAAFAVKSVAIGGSGEAFAGDGEGHVAIRPAGASFAVPQALPGSFTANGNAVHLAANAAGEAFAAYGGAAANIVLSRRPPGGDWAAPTAVANAPAGAGIRAATLSDGGTGVATYTQSGGTGIGPRTSVLAAISVAGAPLAQERVSPPDLDADMAFDNTGLDSDAAGDVAVAWERYNLKDILFARRIAQVGVRRSGGAFGAAVTLTPAGAVHAGSDTADVAIDARGELLATWADKVPGEVRLSARWFAPDGTATTTVLDSAPLADFVLPAPQPPRGHAARIDSRHRLRATARGRVAVALQCVSYDARTCKGTLTLAYGTNRRTAGRARFTVAAGRTRRISVPLRSRALKTLRRLGELSMTATAHTTSPNGAFGRSSAPLTVSAPAGGRTATLRVTRRDLPSRAIDTEGAIQTVTLRRENGSKPILIRRSSGAKLAFTKQLPAGGYSLDSWTQTCSSNCGAVDPPTQRCRLDFRIGEGAQRRYEIATKVGGNCAIRPPR